MLTCRDKMFGTKKEPETIKQFPEEEQIEYMYEVFEKFIEDFEDGNIEKWSYNQDSHLGWGIQENTITWETEIHP